MSFKDHYEKMAQEAHAVAVDKGWWDHPRAEAEAIALMHSELSEALEALRKPVLEMDDKCPGFTNVEIEYADLVIRVMDNAVYRNHRVGAAIEAKTEYNKTRAYKHGKKF